MDEIERQVRDYIDIDTLDFPVETNSLVARAAENGADIEILGIIERLPDTVFDTPQQLDNDIHILFMEPAESQDAELNEY